jgi:dipeptidyl aminopeptidase/acylaminoacyl peptidase
VNREDYLDALINLPKLGETAVSPDGRWVAWSWFGVGPTADVYVAPADLSAPPIRLTETDQDVILASWTPDSRAVIVGQDHDGDERVQLFRVDLDRPASGFQAPASGIQAPGVMTPLTEPNPPYFLRGGQLHPNGRWLVYAMNFDVESGQEIEPTWLYRHDLETGERRVLARPLKGGYYVPALNDAGTHVLYHRQDIDPAGYQVWLVDIEGEEDREIISCGPTTKVFASWFPDSKRALLLAEAGAYRKLGVWDMRTEEATWLLDDPARNIEDAFVPRGSKQIVVIEIEQARLRASLLDVDTGREARLPDIPGNLSPRRPAGSKPRPAGSKPRLVDSKPRPLGNGDWIGRYYSSTQPSDLVRFSAEDVRPEQFQSVTRVWERTPLRSGDLFPAQDFRWRSADGLEIQGWLYRPDGSPRGTIVNVHGGPTSHYEDELSAQVQFYVSEGFTVLQPNYRGSTGFGLPFMEAIKEDGWGGREQDDIRTGIEALIDAGIAEPGKVGITGISYGGYSAWCAITRFPREIVAAAAPICGMTDLVVDYETTRPDLRPYSEEMLGGRPDQVPERYWERSPIHFVDRIRGKLLIVQGLRDPNVTPENVRAVRAALDQAGVVYEILTFEDEGHGIYHPKNLKPLYTRLVEFFAEAFAQSLLT